MKNTADMNKAKKMILQGLFPFSVATRFRYSSLAQIEKSKETVSLAQLSLAPVELLHLYCFKTLTEKWPNAYAAFKPVLGKDIDFLLDSYVTEWAPKWGPESVQAALAAVVEEFPVTGDESAPYTPRAVVDNMVSGLDHSAPVFDPYCGYGEFLLSVKEHRLASSSSTEEEILSLLAGVEKCKLRAFIAGAVIDPLGVSVPKIFTGNPVSVIKNPRSYGKLHNTIVVGNFPFQEQTGKDGTATKDLSGVFVEQICSAEPSAMVVVLPEKKKKTVTKMLFDMGLKKYKVLGRTAFPDIATDTCWVFCEPGYTGETEIIDYRGSSVKVSSEDFVPNDIRAISLFRKLAGQGSLEHRFNGAGAGASSGVHSNLILELDTVGRSADSVEVVVTPMKTRRVTVASLQKIAKRDPKIKMKTFDPLSGKGQHKLVLSSAASRTGLGNLKVVEPGQVCGWTACRLDTQSKEETLNLKTYLETKFVRALVAALKTSTANSKTGIFRYIPDVDLSVEWTDAKLNKHFKLTQAEVELVSAIAEAA